MTNPSLPAFEQQRLQNSSSAAPIDLDVLLARCLGNVSFALALLSELETSGKRQVDVIVLHATAEETHEVAQAAHSLKGAAAIMGAEPLRQKAAEIEAACRARETAFLMDMVHDLRVEMDRCLAFIPTLRTASQHRST